MKTITSKKVLIIISIALVLIASVVISFIIISQDNPEKKILGHWILTEKSKEDYHGNYISEELIFFDNGIYSAGQWQGKYAIDNDHLSMTYVLDSCTYTYFIKNDTLALKDSRKDSNFIYYKKAGSSDEQATKDETTAETTDAITEVSINLLNDDANLFSKSEEAQLNKRLTQIREEYSFDIVIHTTDSFDGKSAKEYADDYYNKNGYGYGVDKDGCVLVMNEKEGEWYLSTCGNGITLINDKRLENIKKAVQPEKKNKQYYNAVSTFLNYLIKYL